MVMLSRNVDDRFFDAGGEPGKLLAIGELCTLLGISRSMVYKCMKSPTDPLPTPIKIGSASRWLLEDIIEWARDTKERQKSITNDNTIQ